MRITFMYRRSMAHLTVLTVAALATMTILVNPGIVAPAEASQTVDAKVSHGVLRVKGTHLDDQLTFRLNANDANVLEIDVGDDGTADFSVARSSFAEITVNSRNGDDLVRVDEANGPVDEPASIRGGNGDDTILGGSAVETIYGGPGDDFIDGNRANDVAFMGPGKDTFRWDPGDASDVIEGGDGPDVLLFNGANVGEAVDLAANGERFTFFRNPGNITMDMNGVESAVFNALGGADTVNVGDLTSTGVLDVQLNLDNGQAVGDGQADRITVNGTDGDDNIAVTGAAGAVAITGLSAAVDISAAEFANDRLDISTGAGTDSVDASALADGVIQLFVDGVQLP